MKKGPLLIIVVLGIILIERFSVKESNRVYDPDDFFGPEDFFETNLLDRFEPELYVPEPIPDNFRPYGLPEEDAMACAECIGELDKYDSLKRDYFLKRVYEPSMSNPKVSYNNKQLLKRIKSYLECDDDSCGADIFPVLPVYRMSYLEGKDYVSIFSRFPFNDTAYYLMTEDTVLHHGLMQKNMHVYYSNHTNASQHKVKFYDDFQGDCELFRTFVLYETDTNDRRKPEFALPFPIDMKPVQDTVFDQLINKNINCENYCRYCDPLGELMAWGELTNVPGLFFVTDKPDDWQEFWFPSRSIYLNIDNKFALELFRFEVELVECSCI